MGILSWADELSVSSCLSNLYVQPVCHVMRDALLPLANQREQGGDHRGSRAERAGGTSKVNPSRDEAPKLSAAMHHAGELAGLASTEDDECR